MLRNTALYAFARFSPAAINFLALSIYSRLLDRATYGRYALLIASVSLAGAVGYQWLRLGLIRFLESHAESRERFLSTVAQAFGVVSVAALLVSAGAWYFLRDPELRRLVPLGLGLLWAQGAFDLTLDISVARLDPVRYGLTTLARAAVGVGLAGLLAWRGYGLPGIVIGLIVGCLVPLVWTLSQWPRVWGTRPDHAVVRQLLQYGVPLIATVSLEFIINASDRFLLGWLNGAEAVGSYAVGYDLSQQSLTVLMVTVNMAAWPTVVRALTRGEEAARTALTQQATLLFAIGLPAAAGMALLAPNIAHVVLGSRFELAAAALIPVIALAAFIAGLKSYYFDLSFQIGNATRNQLSIMLVAATTNVACNLVWIPRYGPMGAAWATVAAYGVGLVASWWRGASVFAMPLPWRAMLRVVAATLAMCVVLWQLRRYVGLGALVAQLVAGGVTFLVGAILLNVLAVRDQIRTLIVARAGDAA